MHDIYTCDILYVVNMYVISHFTGWWSFNPSEKYEFVSWDYYSQLNGKMKNVPNHYQLWYVPSGYVKIAIQNGPVEIVDLPIKNSDFPVRYIKVYQRVMGDIQSTKSTIDVESSAQKQKLQARPSMHPDGFQKKGHGVPRGVSGECESRLYHGGNPL